jgi:hypothetical protein
LFENFSRIWILFFFVFGTSTWGTSPLNLQRYFLCSRYSVFTSHRKHTALQWYFQESQ